MQTRDVEYGAVFLTVLISIIPLSWPTSTGVQDHRLKQLYYDKVEYHEYHG